jgi:2,3-dihydroxybenzoate decarboxylase
VKKKTRPSKEDYGHYMRNNVSITSSGNYSTKVLKFCINEIGLERCLFSIGMSTRGGNNHMDGG